MDNHLSMFLLGSIKEYSLSYDKTWIWNAFIAVLLQSMTTYFCHHKGWACARHQISNAALFIQKPLLLAIYWKSHTSIPREYTRTCWWESSALSILSHLVIRTFRQNPNAGNLSFAQDGDNLCILLQQLCNLQPNKRRCNQTPSYLSGNLDA